MTMFMLTAANQLPVLMAPNRHFPDIIVLLEGFRQTVGREERPIVPVLFRLFLGQL